MYRLLEEALEMLCYIIVLVGALFLFSNGVKDRYELNFAEQIVETFFEEAERNQKIVPENLEAMKKHLFEINTKYDTLIQIKRKGEIFHLEDLREYFVKEESFLLKQGDFIFVCIREDDRERSIRYTMIWW